MTASISVLINVNGYTTRAIVDSAAMVTLVQEGYFRKICSPQNIWQVCVLTGIGADPVQGYLVPNVPITVGSQTSLHTVCVAPVKDICLLGLDSLKDTGSQLVLGQDVLRICGDDVPLKISAAPGLQISRATVAKHTVVQPNTVGYVRANLQTPIEGPYIIASGNTSKNLLSHVCGVGSNITLKVVNDSESFITFRKGKPLGHAESVESYLEKLNINKSSSQETANQTETMAHDLPNHLQEMYEKNSSDLSADEKVKFRRLLSFRTCSPKMILIWVVFLVGLNTKFRHTMNCQLQKFLPISQNPTSFPETGKRVFGQTFVQGVIEPSISEWSAAPVLVRKISGELRYCIDYPALNAKTVKDNYSLPLINDCLDSLFGKKLFCVLDLCSG